MIVVSVDGCKNSGRLTFISMCNNYFKQMDKYPDIHFIRISDISLYPHHRIENMITVLMHRNILTVGDYDGDYNYHVYNEGSLEQLQGIAERFCEMIIKNYDF